MADIAKEINFDLGIDKILQPEEEEKPRFKTLSEIQLQVIENGRIEESTMKQTKWGVKIFKGKFVVIIITLYRKKRNTNKPTIS